MDHLVLIEKNDVFKFTLLIKFMKEKKTFIKLLEHFLRIKVIQFLLKRILATK